MAHKYQSWKKQGLNTYQVSLSLSLIAVLCITTFAAPKQEFDAEPVDTEVNPGQITKLTCKVRNIQSTCHWLKSDSRSGNFAIRSKIPGSYEYKTDPSDGDCSITILNTSLLQDDAFWQCQVTTLLVDQSNLLSNPVKLTVRNAPESPIIEHDGQQHGDIRYNSGDNFVAEADKLSKFTCVSRKGNPPAILKWFIDNTEITGNALQINETEIETPKTFRAISSLSYTFNKEHHDKKLKCVALHAAYPTGSLEVVVNLNISYIPVVKLEGTPTSDLKEGDQLTLKCIATANPPAKIIWKKSGNQNYGFEEVIKFNNIRRSDAGIYSCSARNTLGESRELSLMLDVKFKPEVVKMDPPSSYTALLYQSVNFHCTAEGNPPPRYNWLQNVEGQDNTWQHRGGNSTLYIQNVTYSYQGRYICEVGNIIGGKEYKNQSGEIDLDIVGPPQYFRETKNQDVVVVERDEDAVLGVIFCSDPAPKKIFWEWGSTKVDLGVSLTRYISKPLIREELPKDCYEARLIVQNVEGGDARKYSLYVKNEKGETNFQVSLQVKEPVTMSAVIGIVVGCIVVVIIVFLVVIYLLKKERCFIRRHGFHPESENSSQRLADELQNGRSPSKDRAIPPDALYTDVQAIRHYDNMNSSPESKRSPDGIVYADLDLPALKSEKPKLSKSHEKIEYAEIQFKPNDSNKNQDE